MRAVADGAFDPAAHDPLGSAFWRALGAVLAEYGRRAAAEAAWPWLLVRLAQFATPKTAADQFDAQQEGLVAAADRLSGRYEPWAAAEAGPTARIDQAVAAYKAVVGDPDDPAFIARVEADARRAIARKRGSRAAAATAGGLEDRIRARDAARGYH